MDHLFAAVYRLEPDHSFAALHGLEPPLMDHLLAFVHTLQPGYMDPGTGLFTCSSLAGQPTYFHSTDRCGSKWAGPRD